MKYPQIAIFVHAYYLDKLLLIEKYLDNISQPFDLYVNFASKPGGRKEIDKFIKRFQLKYRESFFSSVSLNRGMDPGGFAVSCNQANRLNKKYDYICKIHTKAGKHNTNPFDVNGSRWCIELLDTLLGSPDRVKEIMDIFTRKPDVGMISSSKYLCQDMGTNIKDYNSLCKEFKINKFSAFPYLKSFYAGTMFWVRGDILKAFRHADFHLNKFEEIDPKQPLPLDGTMAHAFERAFSAIVRNMGYRLFSLPIRKISSDNVKLISFYFPQFHQSDLNDILWGKGFTDWDNLKKAKPKRKNQRLLHPHRELGYYDLLSKSTRQKQAELAKQAGIYGFCYHHYWFAGKRALYKPLEKMLEDGEPDLPFCLNWANESWTNNWDGKEDNILVKQEYGSLKDWDQHFFYLLNFFKHKNYIKIDNKPVFLMYRPSDCPLEVLGRMVDWWNSRAKENSFNGIYFIQCLGNFDTNIPKAMDGVCEFQPNFSGQHLAKHKQGVYQAHDLEGSYQKATAAKGDQTTLVIYGDEANPRLPYRDYTYANKIRTAGKNYYNGFFPGWDNTPRRQESEAIFHNQPIAEEYKLYLTKQIHNTLLEKNPTCDEKIIFMNSWNEWGEGCVLEPNHITGNKTLEETKEVLDDISLWYIEKEPE